MPVKTVSPCHCTSLGKPTFTDSNLPTGWVMFMPRRLPRRRPVGCRRSHPRSDYGQRPPSGERPWIDQAPDRFLDARDESDRELWGGECLTVSETQIRTI